MILVHLFREINNLEEKAIITDEFKDITNNDMHVIEAIGLNDEKNMSTIAGSLSVTVGTLTTAMNSLVKKGYVVRRRGEKDKRVVYISLSEKGKKAYLHHEKFHKEMIDAALQRLDSEKTEVLVQVLKDLAEFLSAWKQ
ncbi:MAG: MarR family transcriptional regulator [Lachnospiraceae bacterium]|nr:MarR family transcriptional regulator [Lachnospiraceae bacterium]